MGMLSRPTVLCFAVRCAMSHHVMVPLAIYCLCCKVVYLWASYPNGINNGTNVGQTSEQKSKPFELNVSLM